MSHLLKRQKKNLSKVKPVLSGHSKRTPKSLLTVSRRYFFCGSLCFLCFVFALPLCVSVYMCLMVTCLEGADLLALVCGVLLWVCHFPIGILGQMWYLIVSIPDLCTLTYCQSNYRLMPVKSIEECSKGSILQYFRPSLSCTFPLRLLFCTLLSGRLRQVLLP